MNLKVKVSQLRNSVFFDLMSVMIILLIGYFFGIQGVTQDTIRRDELTTLGHIGALEKHANGIPIQKTIDSVATYSAQHPPLYYVIANLWGKFFSFHSYILRVLSLLFGILTLAVIYRLARDIGGRVVAIYAMLLMATSIMFLFYTHEIREYSSLLFWTGVLWLIYRRLIRKTYPLKMTQLGLLTLVTACAMYSHYASIFLLVTIGIYHVLFLPKTRAWWQISIAIVLAGVAYIPWLPTVFGGLDIALDKLLEGNPRLMYNNDLITIVPQFWANGETVLFFVLLGLGIISALLNRRGSRYVMFFCVAIVMVILLINGRLEFIKRLRYVLITLIPFYILGGMGLALLHRWRFLPLVFIVAWISVGTNFQTNDEYYFQTGLMGASQYIEYHALVPLLEAYSSPNDMLITVITDFSSLKKSKQGKLSIEKYYLQTLDMNTTRIFSYPQSTDLEMEAVLREIEGIPALWITHRGEPKSEQIEFIAEISSEYHICKHIAYGEESLLEHYVDATQFEALCVE